MSELTRRMWKEALGDEYESPSQCYNSNIEQDASHVNDSVVSRQTGRVLNFEEPATSEDTEADKHIQALADLISKGKQDNDRQQQQYADVPNTAPHESGMNSRRKSVKKSSNFFILFRDGKYGTTRCHRLA